MAKTINRVPFTVKTDPDIDYKFFAHGNWNGICTDKNYFNIDQETFEDANNVYIDSNGVLSSRPTVQQVLDADGSLYTHIQRQWQFGDVIVRQLTGRKLYFYKQGNMVAESTRPISDTAYIIENDGKLFIFDDVANRIDSYNKSTTGEFANEYKEGCDVYIPVKYTYTNMIKSRVAESPNILTDAYIDRYLYSRPLTGNGSVVNFEALDGRGATITIGEDSYKTTLNKFTPETIFSKTSKLPINVIDRYYLDGEYHSSGGKIGIFCKLNSVTIKDDYKHLCTWDIYYTLDGVSYTLFDVVQDCVSVPKISQDGTIIGVLKETSLCVRSTVTPGDTPYDDWTDIYSFSEDFYRNSTISTNKTTTTGVAIDIVNDKNYVIVHMGIDTNRSLSKAIVVVNGTNVAGSDVYYYYYSYDSAFSPTDFSNHYSQYEYAFPKAHLRVRDGDWSFAVVNETLTYLYPVSQPNSTYLTVVESLPGSIYGPGRVSSLSFFNLPTGDISVCVAKADMLIQYYHRKEFFEDEVNGEIIRVSFITMECDDIGYTVPDISKSVLYGHSGIYNVKFTSNGIITSPVTYYKYLTEGNYVIIHADEYISALSYDGFLYSSVINNEISIDVVEGNTSVKIPKITIHNELDGHYIAYEKDTEELDDANTGGKYKIAISAIGTNSTEFQWYFPELHAETFSNPIVDLHAISTSEMGVFLENEVWYIGQTESGHYTYTKSKLPLGCKAGSNVISSYDGKNLMMLTERGFVALSYQDFVASTDQVLSFLSDSIDEIFIPYIKKNICKLYKHKYWILVYSDSTTMYVYDIRNGSWWKWTLPSGVSYPITVNDEVSFVNSTLYKFTNVYDEYKDYNDSNINWYIVSQKLHLNTLNYYKRLVNMTLNSLHAKDETQKMILSTTNYRDKSYEGLTSKPGTNNTLDYDVDLLRTYVKRLNYGKLVEFQYKLRNNERVELQPQLKLNSIIIKYVITGVIR